MAPLILCHQIDSTNSLLQDIHSFDLSHRTLKAYYFVLTYHYHYAYILLLHLYLGLARQVFNVLICGHAQHPPPRTQHIDFMSIDLYM